MIWPFLLAAYIACVPYNWRAGLAFLCGLASCRIILTVGSNEQLAIFASYSCLGIASFFLLDRIAAATLCVVAILYGISLIDLVDQRVKNIGAEFIFLFGAFLSAYIGPTGGLWGFFNPDNNRRGNIALGSARSN